MHSIRCYAGDAFYGFFFQAEDGIRDTSVTGVQTCALPILTASVWPLQPEHTELEHLGKTDAVTYLRTQGIARIVLDNVPNIQASWVTMGPKIGQVALRFGANDFGSLMMEENVVSAAGTTWRMTLPEMQRLIADAGYVTRQRRQDYSVIEEAA